MTRSLALATLAAALVLPSAARADWGIRAGLEAPVATHLNDGNSYSIGDTFQPSIDLLVQYGPSDIIAFGLEGRIGFASTNGNYTRTGTALGPELMLNIPVVPLYARVALPIRLEPDAAELGLRLAAGLKINFAFVGIYLEGVADMPFVGKDTSGNHEDAFSHQVISVGAGVEFRI